MTLHTPAPPADFHGSWDATVGVNSPLRDQSSDPEPGWSLDGCVNNWASRGAPREKMNVGLAFYGRSFRGATGLGAAHGGADDKAWPLDEGSPQYFVSFRRGAEGTNTMTSSGGGAGSSFLFSRVSLSALSPRLPSFYSFPSMVVLFHPFALTSSHPPPKEYHRKDRRDDRRVGRRNVDPHRVFQRWQRNRFVRRRAVHLPQDRVRHRRESQRIRELPPPPLGPPPCPAECDRRG